MFPKKPPCRRVHRAEHTFVVSLVCLLAVGCGSGSNAEGSDEASPAEPPRPANLGNVLQIRGDTIEVRMEEYIFGFPSDTLPAGRFVLEIQNLGWEGHNIEISQNDSILWALQNDLSPMEFGYLDVTLEPGEYEVWCTVGGHQDKGMSAVLTVESSES